jgi:hypothetical protein
VDPENPVTRDAVCLRRGGFGGVDVVELLWYFARVSSTSRGVMSRMNGAEKKSRDTGVARNASTGQFVSKKAPKNARVVKSSAKTGTISRAAARAAVKAVLAEG